MFQTLGNAVQTDPNRFLGGKSVPHAHNEHKIYGLTNIDIRINNTHFRTS